MDVLSTLINFFQTIFSTSELAYITAAGGAITVVIAFYKRLKRFVYNNFVGPVKKFFESIEELDRRVQELEKSKSHDEILLQLNKLDETYNDIKKEMTQNGGSSMKDMITALSEKITKICDNSGALANQFNRLEALQKSIVNTSDRPTFETDPSGACIFANKAYLELVSRAFEDIKNFGWINIIHPDDRQMVKKEWESAVNDNRNFELSFRIIKREQTIYRVFCEAHPINGSENGYIGHFEDIQEIGKYN